MFDNVTIPVSDRDASERSYGGGAPGPRRQCSAEYYGGFPLDPDEDNVEVVNHNR